MQRFRPDKDRLILGSRTSHIGVRGRAGESREWIRHMPYCAELAEHHISHTGIVNAKRPYEVVRVEQSGTYMMACLEGEGVVLVDGVWKTLPAGQACLLPPFVMNSFKCAGAKRWRFCWVRYEESRETKPIVSSLSPVIGSYDAHPLETAIKGLHGEVLAANNPTASHHWCMLIHHYVQRFAQPAGIDERLWRLWQQVEKDPARAWTLDDFSEISCLSGEHLRRLCLREIGRSPMRHLTFIRLQRARHLLTDGGEKLETIAREVGFSGIHSFSKAFKTWFGKRPSEFR